MKNLIVSCSCLFLFLPQLGWTAPLDFHGYLRTGSGSNLAGGRQECYTNPGSQGNEFRLGNECGIYGEASLTLHLAATPEERPLAHFTSTFAYAYEAKKDWETSGNNWVLRESFVELQALAEQTTLFWIGKRFFRWDSLHAFDFFPINFAGPGGGVEGVTESATHWKIGVIQNTESKEIQGSGSAVTTGVGEAARTSLHLRIEDVLLSSSETVSFWIVGAVTPATTSTSLPSTDYKAGTGQALAIKYWKSLQSGGQEFGIAFGSGVLSNLGPDGELVKDCNDRTSAICQVQSSSRTRLWSAYTQDGAKVSTQIVAAYDFFDKGTLANSKVRWASLGIAPVYYWSDRFQLTGVIGYSNVEDESDGLGEKVLTRVTFGPQISLGRGFYSRPVLRAFYTRSMWNSANNTSFASTSAKERHDAQAVGIQAEIWF